MNTLNQSYKKNAGDTLTHDTWNDVIDKVNEVVGSINNGGGSSSSTVIDTNGVISVSNKGNVTLGSNKNVNIEPAWDNNTTGYTGNYGDVAIKSGDDIQFCSHHREPKKRDKIVIKNIDGSDNPVKLEVHAGEVTLSTKNKALTYKKDTTTGADTINKMFKAENAKVMDVNIVTGNVLDDGTNDERDERGYLKVRALAIDLRCEKHGGIALQPKGYDADGNMNKIKFEHGGGDGLEFGTFNTEKTSIFTDEYRFNREGVWKMATREKEASGKTILDEREDGLQGLPATGAYKYVKQADDFYDIINLNDEQCTTKDIIKTAYALNGSKDRHTKITNKGAIEIATEDTYVLHITDKYLTVNVGTSPAGGEPISEQQQLLDIANAVHVNTISTKIAAKDSVSDGEIFNSGDFEVLPEDDTINYYTNEHTFTFSKVAAPNIKIESGGELKLGGILDFGSSFNFGETDNGVEFQYKLTKKNATKDCGVLKVVGVNNHATNSLTVEGVTIAPGLTGEIASCSVLDMIKLVNYMKTNNQGPWAANS